MPVSRVGARACARTGTQRGRDREARAPWAYGVRGALAMLRACGAAGSIGGQSKEECGVERASLFEDPFTIAVPGGTGSMAS